MAGRSAADGGAQHHLLGCRAPAPVPAPVSTRVPGWAPSSGQRGGIRQGTIFALTDAVRPVGVEPADAARPAGVEPGGGRVGCSAGCRGTTRAPNSGRAAPPPVPTPAAVESGAQPAAWGTRQGTHSGRPAARAQPSDSIADRPPRTRLHAHLPGWLFRNQSRNTPAEGGDFVAIHHGSPAIPAAEPHPSRTRSALVA